MRKRHAVFCLAVIAFLLPLPAFSEPSGWIGGFDASSEGFSWSFGPDSAEFVGISLFAEPWSLDFLTPSLSAGILVPAVPFNLEAGFFTAEVGVELFALKKHPFSWAIDLQNRYAPRISLRRFSALSDITEGGWALTLAPLRLKTGPGRYSLLSLSYVVDNNLSYAGWGVSVFRFRLFIY